MELENLGKLNWIIWVESWLNACRSQGENHFSTHLSFFSFGRLALSLSLSLQFRSWWRKKISFWNHLLSSWFCGFKFGRFSSLFFSGFQVLSSFYCLLWMRATYKSGKVPSNPSLYLSHLLSSLFLSLNFFFKFILFFYVAFVYRRSYLPRLVFSVLKPSAFCRLLSPMNIE